MRICSLLSSLCSSIAMDEYQRSKESFLEESACSDTNVSRVNSAPNINSYLGGASSINKIRNSLYLRWKREILRDREILAQYSETPLSGERPHPLCRNKLIKPRAQWAMNLYMNMKANKNNLFVDVVLRDSSNLLALPKLVTERALGCLPCGSLTGLLSSTRSSSKDEEDEFFSLLSWKIQRLFSACNAPSLPCRVCRKRPPCFSQVPNPMLLI